MDRVARVAVFGSLLAVWVLAGSGCGGPDSDGAAPDNGTAGASLDRDEASSTGGKAVSVRSEQATFGAGCFWGAEAAFRRVEGVTATAVGFMGGSVEKPPYKEVCTGRTGHAEVVQVEFDPGRVSYDQLLEVFWNCHDPTQLNRQGPDVGEQYRSVIFVHSPEQEAAAQASEERARKSGRYEGRIVTAIEPASQFNRAEEHHQQYLEKRGQTSCAASLQR